MSKEYFVFNEEPNTSILGLEPLILTITGEGIKKIGGANLSILPFEFNQGQFRAIANIAECTKTSEIYLSKVETNPKFEKQLVSSLRKNCFQVEKICKKILSEKNIQNISEAQKIKLIKKIYAAFINMCLPGLIPPIIEMGTGGLTQKLNQIFNQKATNPNLANQYLSLLTFRFNESYDYAIQKDLAAIAQNIYLDKNLKKLFETENDKIIAELPKKIHQQIDKFIIKWGWAYFGYSGPAYEINRALGEIKGLLALEISPKKQIEKIKNEIKQKNKEQKKIFATIKFTNQELYLIKTAQDFSETKNIRAKMMCLASFTINELLKSFAIKESMSLKQFGALTLNELYQYFDGKPLPAIKDLNERNKYSLLISRTNSTEEILYGDQARKWVNDNVKMEEISPELKEISGQVACQGEKSIVTGKVKLIYVAADMKKFHEGDILVSNNTIPEIVPAMKKAAAIVTDVGGLTCHAAIISREINKLCIIGTKIATRFLKDDDLVEVDANKGIVKKL